jgi:hypothetical protein
MLMRRLAELSVRWRTEKNAAENRALVNELRRNN